MSVFSQQQYSNLWSFFIYDLLRRIHFHRPLAIYRGYISDVNEIQIFRLNGEKFRQRYTIISGKMVFSRDSVQSLLGIEIPVYSRMVRQTANRYLV